MISVLDDHAAAAEVWRGACLRPDGSGCVEIAAFAVVVEVHECI